MPLGPAEPQQVGLTESQQTALARLHEVLRRGGLAVLCGASGTGKTMLVRRLASECAHTPGWSVRGPCGVRSFLEQTAARGVDLSAGERRVLAVIDDAHRVHDGADLARVVDALQMPPAHAVVVLVGEGRLLTLLSRQPDLEQRVVLRAPLTPWRVQETQQLIGTRLPSFGARPDAEPLCLRLHELAAGIPRQVVRLIDTVAMVLSAEPSHCVTLDDLETFHRRLSLQAA